MSNYIEFVHDQSDASVGSVYQDISENGRVEQYNIITKDFFTSPGWYTYYRYTDINKSFLIDQGKCFINDPKENVIYNKTTEAKKIYKR